MVFSTFLALTCSVNQDVIDTNLVNSKVERTIDLTTHLPKVTSVITLENTGSSSVKSFLVVVDASLKDYVAVVTALVSEIDQMFSVVWFVQLFCAEGRHTHSKLLRPFGRVLDSLVKIGCVYHALEC